ncbi:hypothetical protein DRW41_13040 [Neobacillus piezotolerans]|uniref:Uncharacterized protein n=1 Tax=Neobacillus piezotolerans TaxID=2259171 RepID=A0A3D8GQ92_9BACI|nr:hypothetical protein [Neobacillus piezotolerans]RDU36452.1 hypothetical protein DRW41_13040 [Neobacillus piezotolerans]
MKQIIHFDDHLKKEILKLEEVCENVCSTVEKAYQQDFERHGQKLVLELIRSKKGKKQPEGECFEDDYESFIEIGIEQEDDYFPNGYIPLWKCKEEWFQKTGYLTEKDETKIIAMVREMVKEMLDELNESGSEGD